MKVKSADADRYVARPPAGLVAALLYGPDQGLVHERAERLAKTVVPDLKDPFRVSELDDAALSGDPARLFIGGHSAGGYLTLMLGLDAHYLRDVGVEPSAIAGLIPVSGQTMTHYTVREERGIGKFTITADAAAPVYFIRKDTPPFLVLYADHDMVGRAEENAYFVAMMKGAGNQRINGKLIADRTHGSIAGKITEDGDPARTAILDFITHASSPGARN